MKKTTKFKFEVSAWKDVMVNANNSLLLIDILLLLKLFKFASIQNAKSLHLHSPHF